MDGCERGMDESVYLAPRRRCYHTDANCRQLDRAHSVSEKRWQSVPDDIPECRFCSDEYEAPKNGDRQNLHRKLEALDPSEN